MIEEPVFIGEREISVAAIAAEAQHHPAPSAEAAWTAAARALAVRQLLLDEAERLEIAGEGLTDAEGRQLADEDARIEALLAREVQTPQADEATCRRFFAMHPDRFRTPPLVEAAHILIAADPADDLAMGLATGDARTLIRQLQADPSRFSELARSKSACPSREQGGNLGQVQPGQMVRPFEEALFAMEPESLCPNPVRTRFGVHVIRAGRRAEGRALPFEAVHQAIADYLEEASYRRALSQYIAILAGRADVRGVDLGVVDGQLVQ